MQIELAPYKNPTTTVYTGRPQGIEVREKLKLEAIDKSSDKVEILIPEDTTSFNPSFFLGLLYGSIQKLGIEKFKEKYNLIITTPDKELYKVIDSNLQDGFRNALNSLNKRTGLNSTF
jgi:hypothetical protein